MQFNPVNSSSTTDFLCPLLVTMSWALKANAVDNTTNASKTVLIQNYIFKLFHGMSPPYNIKNIYKDLKTLGLGDAHEYTSTNLVYGIMIWFLEKNSKKPLSY